jgi:hypothetical protein
MPANAIPANLAYAVSLILAFHGFTLFTAPKSLIELALQQAVRRDNGNE